MPDHSGAIKASCFLGNQQTYSRAVRASVTARSQTEPAVPLSRMSMTQTCSCLRCINQDAGLLRLVHSPLQWPSAGRSHLLLVGKRSGSRGQTDRSLNTSLVWRLHQVWRAGLALFFLDGPDAGRAGGSGKVEEGGEEEASLGLTGNLNVVETGQGATRQIHLKPRPTQSAMGSLEAESAGLRE